LNNFRTTMLAVVSGGALLCGHAQAQPKVPSQVDKAEASVTASDALAAEQAKAAVRRDIAAKNAETAKIEVDVARSNALAARLQRQAKRDAAAGSFLSQQVANLPAALGGLFTQPVHRDRWAARYGRACADMDGRHEAYEEPTVAYVTADLRNFAECYRDKAQRRQQWRDAAALTTSVSTMALLIGGNKMAGNSRDAWTVGAVLPLLASTLHGTTYRIQLYQAVSIAMDRTAERYDTLDTRWSAVLEAAPPAVPDCSPASAALDAVKTLEASTRRTVLEQVSEQRVERCRLAQRAKALVDDMQDRAELERSLLAKRAIEDGLDVAVRADTLDRAFRTGPFEAFRTTASAPFSIAKDLLAGGSWSPRVDPRTGRADAYHLKGRTALELPKKPEDLSVDPTTTALYRQAQGELATQVTQLAKADTAKAKVMKAIVGKLDSADRLEASLLGVAPGMNLHLRNIRLLLSSEVTSEADIDPSHIDPTSDGVAAEPKASTPATAAPASQAT
jgi:hypothetical protein